MRLYHISYEYAREKRYYRHYNAVCDKVEEAEQAHSEDCDIAPNTVAERNHYAYREGESEDYGDGNLSFQLELVHNYVNDCFHNGYGGSECGEKHENEEERKINNKRSFCERILNFLVFVKKCRLYSFFCLSLFPNHVLKDEISS